MPTLPPKSATAPEPRASEAPAKRWVIGRDPQNDLVIDAPGVSGRHCALVRTASGYLLEDLGSTNGTYVNGVRIAGRVAVSSSDTITLGALTPMPWPKTSAALNGPAATAKESAAAIKVAAAMSAGGSKTGQRLRIGRAPDNDLQLDYPMVSGHHAELVVLDGQAEIRDLGSSNGTAVGHPTKKISKAPLTPDDTVFLGSLRVPAGQLFKALKTPERKQDNVITVKGSELVFGRSPDCDQVLNYPMISSRHARMARQANGLVIEDLNSSNGTFVNGVRIYRPTPVRAGDVIGLGSFTFTLNDSGNLQKRDYRGHITLEARAVSVEVPKKRLLDPISLTIYPSELVALMGPSGAGKTTLLSALNGYTAPTSGDIFLNGQNLYEHYDQFRTSIGYVPQEDVMHRDLTVGQALFYTARLRLPSDYSKADIEARIAQVIDQLGLQGTENVLIGSAERKGISGGQRKRVNLAMELLTDPLILFLDEPTSGLSSEDALMVMKLLRKLADEGKTILISIHQPSLEVFRLMDNLVVVGRDAGASKEPGELVYYGPAYPEAVQFFNPDGVPGLHPGSEPSPDEVLRGLKKQPVKHWVEKYNASAFQREYVAERASNIPPGQTTRRDLAQNKTAPLSQWLALFARGMARKAKDRVNTALLLAQAPVIGLLLVGVFGKQLNKTDIDLKDFQDWSQLARGVSSCVFQLIVAALWFGCSNAVREIVGEWAVYHRERMVNLRLLPYVAFKFAFLGGLCVLQCAILLGIVKWGCSLKGPFLPMFGVMLLMSLTGVALGLVISAAARTQEIAMALLPVVQLTMVVLGGGMQPVHKLHGTMQVVSHTIPSRWAFESMILLEVDRQTAYEPPPPPTMPPGMTAPKTPPKQDMADYHFPTNENAKNYRGQVWHGVAALSALFTIMLGAIFVILRMRDVH